MEIIGKVKKEDNTTVKNLYHFVIILVSIDCYIYSSFWLKHCLVSSTLVAGM